MDNNQQNTILTSIKKLNIAEINPIRFNQMDILYLRDFIEQNHTPFVNKETTFLTYNDTIDFIMSKIPNISQDDIDYYNNMKLENDSYTITSLNNNQYSNELSMYKYSQDYLKSRDKVLNNLAKVNEISVDVSMSKREIDKLNEFNNEISADGYVPIEIQEKALFPIDCKNYDKVDSINILNTAINKHNMVVDLDTTETIAKLPKLENIDYSKEVEYNPNYFVLKDDIQDEKEYININDITIEIVDDVVKEENKSLEKNIEKTDDLNIGEDKTMSNTEMENKELINKVQDEFGDSFEAVQQLRREMSAHYKADMSIEDAANALIAYTNAAIEDLEVNKDNILQVSQPDGTVTPSYEEMKETLVNKLAYYTNIANSYDKDVQKMPSFEDMTKNIESHKEELQVHEHKIANKVDEIQTQIDKISNKVNDSFTNAQKAIYQKGSNILTSVKDKVHNLQEKADNAKNQILNKWHEFKSGVKDAVDKGIDTCKESYDKARAEISQKKEDIEAKSVELYEKTKAYTHDKFDDVKNAYNDVKVKADIAIDQYKIKANEKVQERKDRIAAIGKSVTSFVKGIGTKITKQATMIYGNFLANQIKELKQVQAVYTNELPAIESSIDSLKAAVLQVENTISKLNDEMGHKIDEIRLEGPENMAMQIRDLANDFDDILINQQMQLKELKQELGMASEKHDKLQAKADKTEEMINSKQDQLDAISMEM